MRSKSKRAKIKNHIPENHRPRLSSQQEEKTTIYPCLDGLEGFGFPSNVQIHSFIPRCNLINYSCCVKSHTYNCSFVGELYSLLLLLTSRKQRRETNNNNNDDLPPYCSTLHSAFNPAYSGVRVVQEVTPVTRQSDLYNIGSR